MMTWATFLYEFVTVLLLSLILFFVWGQLVHAGTIITRSDTLSDSAPNERSDHTLQFTTTAAIPAGGYIRFRPDPGNFTIPATGFDIDNVEFYVDNATRTIGAAVSTSTDGVTITTGSSGNVEITLNSTTGISANSVIRLLLGKNTANATGTDLAILNPSATGTYTIYAETGGTVDESADILVAIVENVAVGPIDTRETDPPIRFNGAPSGTISGTTLNVEFSLETDEFAKCRYSTASGTPYVNMTSIFSNEEFAIVHSQEIAVATNTTYTFYVRCIDDENNVNIDDYVISFFVPEYPEGTPGESGDEEGEGEGTGEGSGDADPGDGSSSGDEDDDTGTPGSGSGGGSGPSGGSGSSGSGGSGGGGFEGSEQPYQSGDGRVIINGYAFPRSRVVVLVDGSQAETTNADSTGDFSVTIDGIASGAYTFGVYAIDAQGVRSTTFSTTFTVTGSRGSTLSNVNIMPTILVEPDPVDPGATLLVSGYSLPDADVTIENQSDRTSIGLKTFTTTSGGNGRWSIDIDTTGFTVGTYKIRAKAKSDSEGISTDWSDFTYYGVGEEAEAPQTSDLNRDGFINLIDFSILLFWWNSDGGNSNPSADINSDGRVSLTDFSIMIFNWTG